MNDLAKAGQFGINIDGVGRRHKAVRISDIRSDRGGRSGVSSINMIALTRSKLRARNGGLASNI
jgi:hypothetical protein